MEAAGAVSDPAEPWARLIVFGDVGYASPEQARGEVLDGRSDLYSAGVLLWELLTGRQLFPLSEAESDDLLTRAMNPAVMPPSECSPRMPKELDDIVMRALSSDRGSRYSTCDHLRSALQHWLARHAPGMGPPRLAGDDHEPP